MCIRSRGEGATTNKCPATPTRSIRAVRILVASGEWFPDRKSGFARVVTETATNLAERGHEVEVLVPRTGHEAHETSYGSLRVRRVLSRSLLPVTFTDVAQTTKHARRYRTRRLDLLVAHGSLTAVGLWASALSVPLALIFHASLPREIRFSRSRLALGKDRLGGYALEPLVVLLERAAVRHADRILVLSNFSRSILLNDHPTAAAKAHRVTGGVDVSLFDPGDGVSAARNRLGVPCGVPLLLTVRRLEPRMGLERLLVAAQALMRSRELALVIIGIGSLGERLRRLSSDLGLEGRVRFVGHVSDDQLRDWYRAADLFVLPTVAYEGFGMATVEALASGTPVVGTPVGATPELLRPLDPRLVARGSESEALAAAIAHGLDLSGPEFRNRCRDYASSNFAWDKVIVGWEGELELAAQTGASRSTVSRA
jgi:glycosyltransferase involved in cell wall biosynthesis